MVYFCADDYGLNDISSIRIRECIKSGALNKVSVFPNFQKSDIQSLLENQNLSISLHLNLVEGKCMGKRDELSLLVDSEGDFKNAFGGLFKLALFNKKEFEIEVYKEIKAQISFWKSRFPNIPFFIDSHQHTHMIPTVFKALIKVLEDEGIKAEYIRIPAEPISLFIKTPSLYLTYSPINIIKQWLLKILWVRNKKVLNNSIPTALFFGILFSGKMDEKRVLKLIPKYEKLANKKGMDIEVLFHPGYLEKESELEKDIPFSKFYLSKNRKIEYDSVMKIKERSEP